MPRLLLAAAVAVALLVEVPAASADDSTVERSDATSSAEQRAVEAFWTPERMREAERQTAARAGTPPDSTGSPWPGGTSRAIGKLFYSLRGRDDILGECSGAVVGGANASVVATAAHCLFLDEDGGAHENLYFVPAYHRGLADYERTGWTARGFAIHREWQRGRHVDNLRYDFGFLTLNPKDGRRIAEVTGAHSVRFESPLPPTVLSVGYPAVFPYDGESLHYCAGPPVRAARARITSGPGTEDNLVLSPCGLTEGSSGGPWIADYDQSVDLGTVVAVTSVGDFHTVVGRPLTGEAQPLFDAAQTG